MLWDTKHVQHDIPQITMIHRNIWTLDLDCSPAGKRSRTFCGRRLNISKSKIRLFMKNLVSKISRHQANTQSWRNFRTWPEFVNTFTKLSRHYGWSLHHKAEQSYGWSLHVQGWSIITVDHYTIRLSNHYGWSLHVQGWSIITVDRYTYKAEQSLWLIVTRTRLNSHYGWSLHVQGWTVITVDRYTYKAEQSLWLIVTRTRLSSHYGWS